MKILNVRIDGIDKKQFRLDIGTALRHDKKTRVAKINPEFIQRAQDNKKFLSTINSFDINIADGRGVLWAAKYLSLPISKIKMLRIIQSIIQMISSGIMIMFRPGYIKHPIPDAIPGIEAFNLMLEAAQDCGAQVFLFGGSEETLKLAVNNIKIDFPKLRIAGIMNGYDYQKNPKINPVAEINKTDAKLLVVALGSPRQEYWISDNLRLLKNIRVAVGEGGTLDRVAYPSQLAPSFINSIGLEWVWRLLFNKSRTRSRNRFQRFWVSVPLFIKRVVGWKIKHGQIAV